MKPRKYYSFGYDEVWHKIKKALSLVEYSLVIICWDSDHKDVATTFEKFYVWVKYVNPKAKIYVWNEMSSKMGLVLKINKYLYIRIRNE